jgi:hypothetical protein
VLQVSQSGQTDNREGVNMKTAVLRDELHSYIDAIPERNLYILRPLLDFLTDKDAADDNLSDEETELLKQCRSSRKERNESLTSWTKVRRG